jgi:hypothetical protein
MFGQDLQQSVIQLGTALNDPITGVGRLRRIGISFTEEQKKSIKTFVEQNDLMSAQRVILDELQVEFGGVAKAMGGEPVTSLKHLSNAFGDLSEAAGESIVNAIAPVTKWLTDVVRKAADSAREINAINRALKEIGEKGIEGVTDAQAAIKGLESEIQNLQNLLAQPVGMEAFTGIGLTEAQRELAKQAIEDKKTEIALLKQRLRYEATDVKIKSDQAAAAKRLADEEERENKLAGERFDLVKELYDKTTEGQKAELLTTIATVKAIEGKNEAFARMKDTVLDYLQTQLAGLQEEERTMVSLNDLAEEYYKAQAEMDEAVIEGMQTKIDLNDKLLQQQLDLQTSFQNMLMDAQQWSDFLATTLVSAYTDSFAAIGTAINDSEEGWKQLKNVVKDTISAILMMISKQLFAQAAVLFASIPPQFGRAGAALMASAAVAVAAGYVKSLKHGGEFETRGPTWILAGDNIGGREKVTATPMTGPDAGKGETLELYLNIDGEVIHKIVNRGIRDNKIYLNASS